MTVAVVAGMTTCFCTAHPNGHPVSQHDARTTGFYCAVPGSCTICPEMKQGFPDWSEPLAPHVHAYDKPQFGIVEVTTVEEEEEDAP